MILADECIPLPLVHALRAAGIQVASIREVEPGVSDTSVLAMAHEGQMLVLTHDRDFGDLVVRHRHPVRGVLLVRVVAVPEELALMIVAVLADHPLDGWLTVLDRAATAWGYADRQRRL